MIAPVTPWIQKPGCDSTRRASSRSRLPAMKRSSAKTDMRPSNTPLVLWMKIIGSIFKRFQPCRSTTIAKCCWNSLGASRSPYRAR
eukprot:10056885-Heterocapsa_arctica.AAC.1